MIMRHTFFLILLFASISSKGQLGFDFYGGLGNDVIYEVTPAGNEEFYLLGGRNVQSMEIWLAKIKASGEIIWEKTFGPPTGQNYFEIGYHLLISDENTFYIVGQVRHNYLLTTKALLIKTDTAGNQIWKKEYDNVDALFDLTHDGENLFAVGYDDWVGTMISLDTSGNILAEFPQEISGQTYIHKIIPADDGNFLLIGRANVIGAGYRGIFIRKITPTGTTLWTKAKETRSDEYGFTSITSLFESTMGVKQDDDGSIWIANHGNNPYGINLFQYDQNGNLLKYFNYGKPEQHEFPTSIIKSTDGSLIITGSTETESMFALKINSEGREEWLNYYGKDLARSISMTVVETSDRYILGGTYQSNVIKETSYDGSLFRIEKDGNQHPYAVIGRVKFDKNHNCHDDPEDVPLSNWFVTTQEGNVSSLILTDENGLFNHKTSSGQIELIVSNKDTSLWSFCLDTISTQFDSSDPSQEIAFLAFPKKECADLEVSLTQPDLVKCDTSCLIATIINHGNIESGDIRMHLFWDKELSLVSTTWPFEEVEDGIQLDFPPLIELQEQRTRVCLALDCGVQLGATHEIKASIGPSTCEEPYTGPFFTVKGSCDGNKVNFSIRNIGGGGTAMSTNYSLYIDELLVSENVKIQLPENGSPNEIAFPADGRTWRVEVQQFPDVPFLDIPSASIEACGSRNTGLHNIDLRNTFRPNDFNKKKCIVMAPNTYGVPNKVAESYTGFGLYNIIMDVGDMEYTARVKNDTKRPVDEVVFDLTLTPTLSMNSFQLLSSNIPSTVSLIDKNSVQIRMSNMNLASDDMAMVRFRVRTVDSLSPNTNNSFIKIEGQAYLDESGPYQLSDGYNNYNIFPQSVYQAYGVYPEYMKMYGGRGLDFSSDIIKGDDQSLFLGGTTSSYGSSDHYSGYVYKTDLSGKVRWQTILHPDIPGSTYVRGIQPDGEGGCIFVGEFLPETDKDNYNYLHFYSAIAGRIDVNGNVVWIKLLRPLGDQYGTGFDGLIKTLDNLYLTYGKVDKGEFERYYLKFDQDGNTIWVKQESHYKLDPYEGISLPDGGGILVGTLLNQFSYAFPLVDRIDVNGKILWETTISTGVDAQVGYIAPSNDGGFVLAGRSDWVKDGKDIQSPIIIKCDSTGKRVWIEKPVVDIPISYLEISGIEKVKNDGYVLTGIIQVDSIGSDFDVLLLKVDDNGKLLWYKVLGGIKDEIPYDILSPSSDSIYIFGNDQGEVILYDLQSFLILTNGEGVITAEHELVSQAESTSTLIFPNPAADKMNIVLSPKPVSDVSWVIFDILGRIRLQGKGQSDDFFQIEISNLPPGSYVITFPGSLYPGRTIIITR